jgi:Phospholipase_D-nuclease N-terminal
MVRAVIIGVAIAVVFTVYAIVDAALADRYRVRALPKTVWLLIVILLPPLGGIVWLLVGRPRAAELRVAPQLGPDDDPAFLGGLGRDPELDARIAQIEIELAALDEEDPGDTPPGRPSSRDDDGPDRRRG